jgi:F0F1-type ATP synthase membrane subunit b/b'
MTTRARAAAVLLVLPLFLFLSSGEPAHGSAAVDFLGKTVNFLVLFGGLAFLLRKPLLAMFDKRALDVREAIRLAEEGKAEAGEKLREADAKMSGLEEEIRRMMDTADAVAEREKERIAGLAAEEVQRIKRFTQEEIDRLTKTGLQDLKAYTAEKATAAALERIRRKLTPADQTALIDKSIERLSAFHEKSGAC